MRPSAPDIEYGYFVGLYFEARNEHVWLLRAEGLTYEQIGQRVGCTGVRCRQVVRAFGKKVSRAMSRLLAPKSWTRKPDRQLSDARWRELGYSVVCYFDAVDAWAARGYEGEI